MKELTRIIFGTDVVLVQYRKAIKFPDHITYSHKTETISTEDFKKAVNTDELLKLLR